MILLSFFTLALLASLVLFVWLVGMFLASLPPTTSWAVGFSLLLAFLVMGWRAPPQVRTLALIVPPLLMGLAGLVAFLKRPAGSRPDGLK